jgi:ribonuclease BN (tRNA processing enzyme)
VSAPSGGPLDLLFLGSGNGFAPGGRYWSSFLLNDRYLFDCCPVALPHLKKAGASLEDIEVILISHFHGDHWFGLPFLLLEYAELTHRTRPLTIIGPPGIEERVRNVTAMAFPNTMKKEMGYSLRFEDLEDGATRELNGLTYTARIVDHVETLQCFGYRAEVDGRTLAYSGDSQLCDALIDLATDADVFVVECSCWDGACGPHMGPAEIRNLRERLGPSTTFVLTHLSPGEADVGIENVLIADDFARFSL